MGNLWAWVSNCVTSAPGGSISVWEQPHFWHFYILSLWLCNLNSVFCPQFCVHCFVSQRKTQQQFVTQCCASCIISSWPPSQSLFPPVPLPGSPLCCIGAVQFSCFLNSLESLEAEAAEAHCLLIAWLGCSLLNPALAFGGKAVLTWLYSVHQPLLGLQS